MDNLSEFGKVFISNTMDATLNTMYKMTSGTLKGVRAEKMLEILSGLSPNETDKINEVIRMSVETAIFNVLFMLEECDDIKIMYKDMDVLEESDGLSGELFGDSGWIKKYSKY